MRWQSPAGAQDVDTALVTGQAESRGQRSAPSQSGVAAAAGGSATALQSVAVATHQPRPEDSTSAPAQRFLASGARHSREEKGPTELTCARAASGTALACGGGRIRPIRPIGQRRRARPAPVASRLGEMELDEKGRPVNLTLAKLRITLTRNLYAVAPGQGLFHWGCSWRHHKGYEGLDGVRGELGLEPDSRVAPVVFADYLARDFRVAADSPAVDMGCYPQGDVPGVRVGVLPR